MVRRVTVVAASVMLASACQAYDRTAYEALVDGNSASDMSAPTCPARAVTDYCASLPALPASPVIDGMLDCGLTLQSIPIDDAHTGHGAPPPGFTVRLAAAWRPDGIYTYVEVTHNPLVPRSDLAYLYCGDAVEVFLDSDGRFPGAPDFDAPGTEQFMVAAPTGDTAMVGARYHHGPDGAWTGSFVSRRTPNGYAVETFHQASDLMLSSWTLFAGALVGLDFSIDAGTSVTGDAGVCGTWLAQVSLQRTTSGGSCSGSPSCNVAAFCRPQLLAE